MYLQQQLSGHGLDVRVLRNQQQDVCITRRHEVPGGPKPERRWPRHLQEARLPSRLQLPVHGFRIKHVGRGQNHASGSPCTLSFIRSSRALEPACAGQAKPRTLQHPTGVFFLKPNPHLYSNPRLLLRFLRSAGLPKLTSRDSHIESPFERTVDDCRLRTASSSPHL